ncbi:hypothetical protein BCR44DRAFT_34520 [Catenaria anguillulae PL171]|uniref:Uncharacterized protein n=1 Tax=Catenaria anguillulae PL171 TaxID=765915 RepID=A0A1Y2I2W7_9FUNG|nr:hypothetical protein BCR44DRAFT_34520 [Catenaria anguillulae PL171]
MQLNHSARQPQASLRQQPPSPEPLSTEPAPINHINHDVHDPDDRHGWPAVAF